jgi:choline-sulfatase
MTDQHRADHVGWHPQSTFSMPNLDRLADGTAFLNCVTANPICTPARTALLTGKYTHQIGTLAMSGDLSLQHPTYAQALQQAGYKTAGIGKFHWLQTWWWGAERGKGVDLAGLNGRLKEFGFDYCWEATGKQLMVKNYCDWCAHLDKKGILEAVRDHSESRGPNFNDVERTEFTGEPWPFDEEDYADIVTGDRVVEWLEQQDGRQPWFCFASFCSPHAPYDPPQRYLDMIPYEEDDNFAGAGADMPIEKKQQMWRLRRAYRAMLRVVDDQIGRIVSLLEEKGQLDDTLIVFTTDHGEAMGDRGHFQKGRPYWQASTVPTLVRHPKHLDGLRCRPVVELTDLTATMLDVAGLDPQQALSKHWPKFNNIVPCRSLMPIVRGEADRVRDYAFAECDNAWQMIQSDRWKYIRVNDGTPDVPHEELYDLQADPGELDNVIADHSEAADWCRRRLLHIMASTPAAQTRWAPLME